MKPPIDNATILITGASAGIGAEFAQQLGTRAGTLILVARRKEAMDALAAQITAARPECKVLVRSCDLSDLDAARGLLDELESSAPPIDVLINNAGFGDFGVFDLADWHKTERMLRLNVVVLAYLTHRLVRPMVARGRGGVMNVSSTYGLVFNPGFSGYIGTKHFVSGFTEALAGDLAGTGVVATHVCPGPTATEFIDQIGNFTGMNTPKFIEQSAADCARVAIRAFERGRARVLTSGFAKVGYAMSYVTPNFVLRAIYQPVGKRLRKMQMKHLKATNSLEG
ncbi:SDR family oxidoreductase [bacterium]|nr:SDR family oxidoreductase [bacterium]